MKTDNKRLTREEIEMYIHSRRYRIGKIRLVLPVILLFLLGNCTGKQSTSPILLLANQAGFGLYTAEILKAEGFNTFQIDSLTGKDVHAGFLKQFDIVVLAETKVTNRQKAWLTEYVEAGGNLIAFRPDKQLSDLFGIIDDNTIIMEGYLTIKDSATIGKGLITEPLRLHGMSDVYQLNGANEIAALCSYNQQYTGSPAVAVNAFGKGQAIAFTYNLPKSIVYTRQGNPEFAGLEKDGEFGIRGNDLFTDGWVDTTQNILNQADEQIRLFSHCLEYLNIKNRPLPRFWYFPDSLKCLAVLDNDGEDNFEVDFEPQFRDVDSMGAKMTLYVKDIEKISKAWVERWVSKGFEIAAHPDDTEEAGNPTWHRMDSILGDIHHRFADRFGLAVHTNVNHWFVWCSRDANGNPDFAAQAKLEEKHGIGMDANFAHYDMINNQGGHFLGAMGLRQGNYTGSGLVMKYADANGRIVNVYQRFNAVYDQQYMESKDPEGFFLCFKGLVDRSLQDEIYSIVSIKAHNNEYFFSKDH